VTLAHRAPAGGNYYVSVAASLEPVDHIVTEMRQLLTLFGFVSVAIAGLTTWYLARRSLAPIDTVARRAKLLGAAHLAERIPVPQHQDEVSEMVVVLNEMLDRLESAFRNQQRFFGEASHELKTPLAVLLAEAQAIARRPFDREESVRFAHSVEGEVRKLLRIVESFLILSRAQPGQRPAVVADVLVEDAVLEAIHRCRVETSQRRVCVIPTFTTGDSMPAPVIAGDFELICSMIESLLFNAVRNSPSGSNVDIDVRSDDGAVEISVRDAGPAVPEREWEQLFKVFYQAPGARAPGRSGIGLSIVKAVAELHGGTVRVRNLSAGCELTVCVPTRQEALPSE
jgi:signal transduction histidine kinase